MVEFYKIPFAQSGDKTNVPETDPGDGSVNFTSGYTVKYDLNRLTDPTALSIERVKMNDLFFSLTENVQQYQIHGAPEFITTSDNGGTAFPYSKYAVVRYNNGTDYSNYQSLVDSNTALPSVTANWYKLSVGPGIPDGDYGDIIVSSSGTLWTIDNNVVTNAQLANMANSTFKGRITTGTGPPENLTPTQATSLLDSATTSLKGLVIQATNSQVTSETSNVVPTPANMKYHQGVCKAWVNFNGTSIGISDSYNVTSVTKNGTGDYTANLSITMANTNYATIAIGGFTTAGVTDCQVFSQTTTAVRVYMREINASAVTFLDQTINNIAVFGKI